MASAPLRPGDTAFSITLPAGNREGQVSLEDYRGRRPVLIARFPQMTERLEDLSKFPSDDEVLRAARGL
jgi:peroxiredoxin